MSHAARKRRERDRQRRGVAWAGVEVGEPVFDALAMMGLLRDGEADDPEKLTRALSVALRDWAAEKKASRVTSIGLGLRQDAIKGD